jgi:probable phosphoglycerate mutase
LAGYLYLCRHGQSQFNAQGILQGQLESALTDLGRQQAFELAHNAKQWNITQIFSSHLGRAKHTAQICGEVLQLQTQQLAGVEERHFGRWQGQGIKHISSFSDFQTHCYSQPTLKPNETAESTGEVRTRMSSALTMLATSNTQGNILLISHGDAIDCLLTLWAKPHKLCNGQGIKLVKTVGSFTLVLTGKVA